MQFATIFAFLIGTAVISISAFTSSKHPMIYLNWHAALVVFGGTFSAAAISFGFKRLFTLVRVLVRRTLFGAGVYDPPEMMKEILRLSQLYRNDPEQFAAAVGQVADPFLKEALTLLVDNLRSPEDILGMLMTRTVSIYQRYNEEAVKFKALAKFPPAFGLMGAVMGMVGIMAEMGVGGSNASVGPSLALALVGTLYGVALANLVILPLAENLYDSAREVRYKNLMVIEAISLMMQKKNSMLMVKDLNSFLLAHERMDWRSVKRVSGREAA